MLPRKNYENKCKERLRVNDKYVDDVTEFTYVGRFVTT
jgi:hypothetical protein